MGWILGTSVLFSGGTGTIDQLQLFKATSSPYNAITTVTFAKSLYLQGSWATSTGMTADKFCLTADSCITSWSAGTADGAFSTTSADYWKTQRNFFSTTSADWWGSQKGYITGIAWGAITGTLSNQTDLDAKFATKIGTSSAITANQLVYATGFNTVASVATSSGTVSSPLTGNFICVGTGCTLGIQSASASQAGALAAADFATFSAKLNLSNLFTLSTTYGALSLSTTTPLWLQGAFNASSTPTNPSHIDNFIANNSTTTNATTTTFGIRGVSSALLLAGATGGITGYVAPSACSNQFLRAITAVGAFTCASVADTDITGTVGVAHGGTASSTLGGILAGNGVSAVKSAALSGLTWDGTTLTVSAVSSASSTLLIDRNTFSGGLIQFSNYVAIGTTTPKFGALTIGSSTAPEIIFTDNIAADPLWAVNILSGKFFLATSTAIATSSVSAFSISNTTGALSVNAGATSTFSSGIQASYLDMIGTTASSTFGNGMTINTGCYAFKNTCLTLATLAGQVNLTSQVTGILPIANGGTNATSIGTTNGMLAFDGTRIVNFANFTLTSTLMTVSNASTTNGTFSQSLFVASKQVNPYQNATFAYGATSTGWTGTTTETRLPAPFSGTLQDVICSVPAGTLNVQFKINSTNIVPMFNASSTVGTVTFTSGNTFNRGDIIEADYGTPATSPVQITCTPRATVTTF
ncbi:hypothetical protein IVB45_02200 [Bradyrhizobium sp. 4]|uniref:hypothetical protein n=1 Tax=Bradyrhizobium sp. 4 TaxID=2782678 RepID=UPI00200042F0|nr:hypothetical protein [Bradyrhizobium sp. 4]UPJ35846.1 hypothetical protein IVB45_02200 [Bradyrhizobium sp. 4]